MSTRRSVVEKDKAAAPDGSVSASALARREALMLRARKRLHSARAFKAQGRDFLARQQMLRVAELVNILLEVDPSNMSARFLSIGALLELGAFQRASQEAKIALIEYVDEKGGSLQDPTLQYAAAYASLGYGNLEAATAYLLGATTDFPNDAQAHAAYSSVLERSGRLEEALEASRMARRLDEAAGPQLLPEQQWHINRRFMEYAAAITPASFVPPANVAAGGSSPSSPPPFQFRKDASPPRAAPGGRILEELGEPAPARKVHTFAQSMQKRGNRPRVRSVDAAPGEEEEAAQTMSICADDGMPPEQPGWIRSKPFGPPLETQRNSEENVHRDAALKDLENLFSSLMPLSSRADGISETAAVGAEGCCSCNYVGYRAAPRQQRQQGPAPEDPSGRAFETESTVEHDI